MSTGAPAITISRDRVSLGARLRDYFELTKARITILELVCVLVAMYLAMGAEGSPSLLAAMIVGTLLVASSANALNQCLERRRDALMTRTCDRPLPSGRMAVGEAAWFGVLTLAFGFTFLALGVNWTTALLALASWLIYVAFYTPLKTRSTVNTTVGAVSGALPIVMGWTAGGGAINLTALGLFGVVFLWQFPHFMAIAWTCREDYRRAGYRMATTVEPTGARAAAHAVAGAAMLIPVSFVPFMGVPVAMPPTYAAIVVTLGVAQLLIAIAFLVQRNDRSARRLLRASLIYLPSWLLALAIFGR